MSKFTKTVAYSYFATLALFIVLVAWTEAMATCPEPAPTPAPAPGMTVGSYVTPDKVVLQECHKDLIEPKMVASETRNGKTIELWMVPCKEF